MLEVGAALKRELYAELARHDLTMKAWFIGQATRFLERSRQASLIPAEDWTESPAPYRDRGAAQEGERE